MARSLWATALVAFVFTTLTGCAIDQNGGPCVVAISGCVAPDASNSTDNGSVSADAGSSDSSSSQPDTNVPKPEVSEQKDVVMANCDKLDAAVGTCIAEISEWPVYIECVKNDTGKCALKVDGPGASFKGTFEDEDGDWPVVSEDDSIRLVTDFDGKNTLSFSVFKKKDGEFKLNGSAMKCVKE